LNFCKYCVLENQTNISFKVTKKENHTKGILDYIHSDMGGRHRQNLMVILAIMSHSWMIIHGRVRSTSCRRNL